MPDLEKFTDYFSVTIPRIKLFLDQSLEESCVKKKCGVGKHEISGECYMYDGTKHENKSAYCSDAECFLSQLERDTIEKISGKDTNFGKKQNKKEEQQNKPTHTAFARTIMQEKQFRTLRDTEEILYYDEGLFKLGGETIIKEMAEKLVPDCFIGMRREIMETIRVRTYYERNMFDVNKNILNVKNGLLNIEEGILDPHTPGYPSRIQIETNYNKDAKCEKFIKFFESVISDENERKIVLELFSAVLLRDSINLEKVMMFEGEGHNGKSTLLRVMSEVIGERNVSHVSIHRIINDRFSASSLDGKLMNIYADIGSGEIKGNGLGILKSLVSGEGVDVEKKNKPLFTMYNFAKMFFSCNRLPEVLEDTDAIYRRFVIIKFLQQFKGEKNNINLFSELTTEEEKSGILNLLIESAKNILKKGGLTYETSTEEMRQEWKEKADPVMMFLHERTKHEQESHIEKNILYQAYTKFCVENNHRPKTPRSFTEKMSFLGYVNAYRKIENKSVRVWIDIKFKDPSKTKQEKPDESDTAKPDSDIAKPEENTQPEDHSDIEIDDTESSLFLDIFKGMMDSDMEMRRDGIVSELKKSGKFTDAESYVIIEKMIETKKIVECDGIYYLAGKKFRCKTCNEGPWIHGREIDGKPVESYHINHEIE